METVRERAAKRRVVPPAAGDGGRTGFPTVNRAHLAKKMDAHPHTVHDWFTGRTTPSLSQLLELTHHLNMDLETLVIKLLAEQEARAERIALHYEIKAGKLLGDDTEKLLLKAASMRRGYLSIRDATLILRLNKVLPSKTWTNGRAIYSAVRRIIDKTSKFEFIGRNSYKVKATSPPHQE